MVQEKNSRKLDKGQFVLLGMIALVIFLMVLCISKDAEALSFTKAVASIQGGVTVSGTDSFIGAGSNDFGYEGADLSTFYTFFDVTIPKGATIVSANLTGRAANTLSTNFCKVKIWGHDISNSTIVGQDTPAQLFARVKTTAVVTWTLPSFWLMNYYSTPDLKTIFQEIVNRSDWVSGNGITIIFNNDASSNNAVRTFYDYWSGAGAAYIDISYNNPPSTYFMMRK